MASAVHIYYEKGVEARVPAILRFLGAGSQPDIMTIGAGSRCEPEKLRQIFPQCRAMEFVENEFEGYQRACELAAGWGEALAVANDTLDLHWKPTPFRRAWLARAMARAAGVSQPHVVMSERHIGRPHKFPGSGGPAAWYTSNYFVTNAPSDLAKAFQIARARGANIPALFRSEGEAAIRRLFGKRGVVPDAARIESKLHRTYIEMCLCPALMETGIQAVWASNGRSVLNLAHKVLVDR